MSYIGRYLAYVCASFVLPSKSMSYNATREVIIQSCVQMLVISWKFFSQACTVILAYLSSSFSGSKNTNLHWTVLVTLGDEPFLESDLKELRVIRNRPCANRPVLSSHRCLFTEPWFYFFIFTVLQKNSFPLVHSLHEHEFCITVEIFWAIKQQAISSWHLMRHKCNYSVLAHAS